MTKGLDDSYRAHTWGSAHEVAIQAQGWLYAIEIVALEDAESAGLLEINGSVLSTRQGSRD